MLYFTIIVGLMVLGWLGAVDVWSTGPAYNLCFCVFVSDQRLTDRFLNTNGSPSEQIAFSLSVSNTSCATDIFGD